MDRNWTLPRPARRLADGTERLGILPADDFPLQRPSIGLAADLRGCTQSPDLAVNR